VDPRAGLDNMEKATGRQAGWVDCFLSHYLCSSGAHLTYLTGRSFPVNKVATNLKPMLTLRMCGFPDSSHLSMCMAVKHKMTLFFNALSSQHGQQQKLFFAR
jgi:hypothetical protein